MQKTLTEYPTIAGPIHGTCYGVGQLSAKFQVWAREVAGVTDRQSLAYLVCDKPEKWKLYFEDEISMLRDAAECERRLALLEKPKDFGVSVNESEICFATFEIHC